MSGKNIWRLCKVYGRLIGYPELKPHDVRHGVAMEVLEQHHDLEEVRALLGLPESLKQTLQGAAVIGRQFALPLLARVLETNGQLPGHLRDLHGLGFIFPTAPELEPVDSFKHALTQDVVYAGVLERRRRAYHAAAGGCGWPLLPSQASSPE